VRIIIAFPSVVLGRNFDRGPQQHAQNISADRSLKMLIRQSQTIADSNTGHEGLQ